MPSPPLSPPPLPSGDGATGGSYEDAPLLTLNPVLLSYPFDSDETEEKVLCEVPSRSGAARRYTVPVPLFALLEQLDGTRTLADVRALPTAHPTLHHSDASWEKIERLIHGYFLPRKILVRAGEPDPYVPDDGSRAEYMTFKRRVFSPATVQVVASRLTFLFGTKTMAVVASVCMAALAAFYFVVEPAYGLSMADLGGRDIFAFMGILFFSTIVHEFGHASAASRFGCHHSEIGWGWYVSFSVWYTDLSEVWRLDRYKRALVDVSGLYFELIYAAALFAAFLLTGYEVLLYCILMMGFSVVSSLNPFLRLDGYWLLSDLGGIPNLRQQTVGVMKQEGRRLLGRPGSDLAGRLSRRARACVYLYLVVSNVFFAWLGYVIFDKVIYALATQYPVLVGRFVSELGSMGTALVVERALELAWKTAVLLFTLRFVGKIGLRLFRWLADKVRAGRGSHSAGAAGPSPL